jgi:hypothetical protein
MAVIEIHKERYRCTTDDLVRKRIVNEISRTVERYGSRFLKMNDSGTGWVRCEAYEIEEKSKKK